MKNLEQHKVVHSDERSLILIVILFFIVQCDILDHILVINALFPLNIKAILFRIVASSILVFNTPYNFHICIGTYNFFSSGNVFRCEIQVISKSRSIFKI